MNIQICVLYLYMYCMHIYIYGKREEENKGRKKDMCNVVAFGPASGLGRSRAGCKLQLDVRFGVGVVHRTAGRWDGRADLCSSRGVATIAALIAGRTQCLPNHPLNVGLKHVGDTMDHWGGRPLRARTAGATPWTAEGGLSCAGRNGTVPQDPGPDLYRDVY